MADLDILSAVGFGSERLLLKLLENHELCNNVMALTALCAIEMGGNRASQVRVSDVQMVERKMIAHVSFEFGPRPKVAADLADAHKLSAHIGKENMLFYAFIRGNPDFIKWLKQIIEKMDTYALQNGIKYSEIGFGDYGAFMDKGNYIVLEIAG